MASNNQQGGHGKSADDRQPARKDGEHSHQQNQSGGDHRQQGGHDDKGRGDNPGNFANDPQRASEAGRKGGQR